MKILRTLYKSHNCNIFDVKSTSTIPTSYHASLKTLYNATLFNFPINPMKGEIDIITLCVLCYKVT